MAYFNFSIKIIFFAVIAAVMVEHRAEAQSMCDKFNIGGPCDLVQATTQPPPTTPAPDTNLDPYCEIACAQDPDNYNDVCYCYEPVTCYYSTQRAARLSSVAKRVLAGNVVSPECDYPGVVGIMRNIQKVLTPVCNGIVLEEAKILITSQCLNTLNSFNLFAMADTYVVSSANKNHKLVAGSEQRINPATDEMVAVDLLTPLTFNSTECVQPVCVPNVNIPVTDINLDDCRIVGYGTQNNDLNSVASQLMEVLVTVDPTTITRKKLTVNRVDAQPNVACFSDDGAPLICSHMTTEEWITIGIVTSIGIMCENPSSTFTEVVSLLAESAAADKYYSNMQAFLYADPNVFA